MENSTENMHADIRVLRVTTIPAVTLLVSFSFSFQTIIHEQK